MIYTIIIIWLSSFVIALFGADDGHFESLFLTIGICSTIWHMAGVALAAWALCWHEHKKGGKGKNE